MKKKCISLEQTYIQWIEKAQTSLFFWILLFPLIPISYFYRAIYLLVKWCRMMRKRPSPLPTITVGNITTGGTGKTPLIVQLFLEEALLPEKTIYISRGYKSQQVIDSALNTSIGSHVSYTSFGDEAALIAKRFPEILFIKSQSGKAQAVQDTCLYPERKCVIVDDGLQHDEIEYTLQIATVDGTNPFGYDWYLPRGLLRESPYQRLKSVDYIILTNVSHCDPQFKISWDLLSQFNKPLIAVSTSFYRFFNERNETVEVSKEKFIRGEQIPIVATGIANPSRVCRLLEDVLGVSIAAELFFADHGQLHIPTINSWIEELKKEKRFAQAECILFSTEKDWIKKTDWTGISCPLYFIDIHVEVVEGSDAWHMLLNKIRLTNKPT